MLVHPDTTLIFVVEVDTSNAGAHNTQDQMASPTLFFFLLTFISILSAIRCHVLEEAEHPFVMRTDHKNLVYLRSAKRLNSHQARWSLISSLSIFFYRPGSRNVKPDALSRQFSLDSSSLTPACVLPAKGEWRLACFGCRCSLYILIA